MLNVSRMVFQDFLSEMGTVDVHVKRLREKIKDTENWSLATVWGVGYKFEVIRQNESIV